MGTMNFLSLIETKREGKPLAPEQIQEFIREFTEKSQYKIIAEINFGIILKL
jgi:thymidine phosphorylase